jgi:CAAX protease family protein
VRSLARQPRKHKRKPRPRLGSSTWTIRYALGALVAVLAAALAIGLAFRGDRPVALGVGGLILDAFMLLTLAPLYRQHRLRSRDLGLRSTAPASAVGLVVLAIIAVAITNGLWLQGVLGKPVQSLGITLRPSSLETVLIGVQMCVSAPVIEEIFFRGLLYRALRNRMNVAGAAVLAGFIFGAVHGMAYPLDTLPPRMVFGVIACLLYERTGSLYPSIALHGLIDGAAFEAAIRGQVGVAYAAYGTLGLMLLSYAGVRRRLPGPSGRGSEIGRRPAFIALSRGRTEEPAGGLEPPTP